MSGTNPPVTAPPASPAPTPVKDAIDAYSGRFEFFKQSLTLGTAVLAGIAALFTDPARIPSQPVALFAVLFVAVSLLVMIAWSAMGLSSYANLLKEVAVQAGLIPNTSRSPGRTAPPINYADGVVSHAQIVLLGLVGVVIGLIALLVVNLFFPGRVTADAALMIGKKVVATEIGLTPQSVQLERLGVKGDDYILTFDAVGAPGPYVIQVSGTDGKVIQILRQHAAGLPPNAPASPPPSGPAPPPAPRAPAPTAP